MEQVKTQDTPTFFNKALAFVKKNAVSLTSILGLAFCLIVFTITAKANGSDLWSAYNIKVIIRSSAVYMVISLGAVFVYSMGYMDVSVGQQLGVYCILMILIANATNSLLLAFVVVFIIALICGVFNGVVAVWLKLPSIVTSLFIMFIFQGLQYLMIEASGSNEIKIDKTIDMSFFKEPWVMAMFMIIVAVVVFYVFNFTRLGRYTKSIGANELTTRQCGVNTTLWKTIAYMGLGACIAIGSLLMLAKAGSAGKGTGSGYAMDVMLCLILGGMPLSGGPRSKVRCAIIGSLTYVILSNGLTLSGVSTTIVPLVKGVIFFVVVILTCRDKTQYLPR